MMSVKLSEQMFLPWKLPSNTNRIWYSKNTWLVGTLFVTWHPPFLALHVGKRGSLHLDKGALALVDIWEHHLVVNSGIITNTIFQFTFSQLRVNLPMNLYLSWKEPQRTLSHRLSSGGNNTDYRSCTTKLSSSVKLKIWKSWVFG